MRVWDMSMRTDVLVLVALLPAGAAVAGDRAAGAAQRTEAVGPRTPRLRLPPPESFRLFPEIADVPRIDLPASDERRLFHQQGDPDSLFTVGRPSPQGELRLLAAIELNEIFLKAVPPDPLVAPGDTRPRAAGSFLPFDSERRPYQLRLGARLVW